MFRRLSLCLCGPSVVLWCDGLLMKPVLAMGNRRTPPVLVVLVTCPTRASGRRLAEVLVSRRLAACVNLLPGVESTFCWKGKRERCRETLLLIKTTTTRFEALRRAVLRLHPYDVPEVIALPVGAGHAPYLEWVRSTATRPRRVSRRSS